MFPSYYKYDLIALYYLSKMKVKSTQFFFLFVLLLSTAALIIALIARNEQSTNTSSISQQQLVKTTEGSGLEIANNNLRLVSVCKDQEILKWNSQVKNWVCAPDKVAESVIENDVVKVSDEEVLPSSYFPLVDSNVNALIGGSTGNLLYRGTNGWTALSNGTTQQVLTSQGAGNLPIWSNLNLSTLPSGSATNSSLRWNGSNWVENPSIYFSASSEITPATNNSGSIGTNTNRWNDFNLGSGGLNIGSNVNSALLSYNLTLSRAELNKDLYVDGNLLSKGPEVNVKAFGALGNGVANDTTSIQNALNSLPTDGGTVLMPAGTYLICGTITIPKQSILKGVGSGTKIILGNSCNTDMINISLDQSVVRDLWLDGNRANQTSGNGITINGSFRPKLQNLYIENIEENGILVTGSAGDLATLPEISSSTVLRSYRGISLTQFSQDAYIVNTYAEEIDDTGFNIQGFGIRIFGGHVYNARVGIFVSFADRTHLINCYSENNGEHGILVSNTQEIQIQNCNVFNNSKSTAWFYSGIVLTGTTNGAIVSNNVIYDDQTVKTQAYGIKIDSGATNNSLINNKIRGNLAGDIDLGDTNNTILQSEDSFMGIGTANPSRTLDINGTARVSGAIELNSSVTLGGITGCASGLETNGSGLVSCIVSDKNLKTNFRDIKNPIQIVKKLNPLIYNWNNPDLYGEQSELGFLAQEVEEVIPELAFTKNDGIKGVKYQQMTALLVAAIQDQQTELETLKKSFENTKGELTVKSGTRDYQFTFSKQMNRLPKVTITPNDFYNGQYRITNISNAGFRVEFNEIQTGDVKFTWIAL